MNWPQIVVALLLLLNVSIWSYAFASARDEISHRTVVVAVLVAVALTCITVMALSAGGFW